MSKPIMTEAQGRAVLHLNEVDDKLEYQTKRLRGLATALLALLPSDPGQHALLAVTFSDGHEALNSAKYALRDNLVAAREMAGMIDDIACVMGDGLAHEIDEARKALGLPPAPSMVRAEEACHA